MAAQVLMHSVKFTGAGEYKRKDNGIQRQAARLSASSRQRRESRTMAEGPLLL